MTMPFVWMLSTSLKEAGDVFSYPPTLIPQPIRPSNYVEALTKLPFHLFYRNTAIVAAAAVTGQILSSSLAGFAFARLRARGQNVLFILVLSTLMVPEPVIMIPTFLIFRHLGWLDTLLPLIVPYYLGGSAFYTFMFRQFFRGIPLELTDAAKIDGCGLFGLYRRILMPLSLPAIASAAIFSFFARWNDFLHPLIYLKSKENFTVALGLRLFQAGGQTGQGVAQGRVVEWQLLMAASVVAMLPCLLIFFFLQRYFVRGIVTTGLKG
ncbi:MAG: carbohydrate ABC transporter permease [Chloroflexi bacterium]|nr:carbohydrate ABC transporter permease [Chloroflexota bacterium]